VARPADLLGASIVVAAIVVAATRCTGAPPLFSPLRASPTLTPGVLNPDVGQTTIRSTICKAGWTRTIRPPVSYTNELKLKQMRRYARSGRPSDYQEDHLISLELGGHPTDERNLWPEPYPRASRVDQLENELNAKVCSGRMTLAEAQRRESILKHTAG
jgi:hypothetical protein